MAMKTHNVACDKRSKLWVVYTDDVNKVIEQEQQKLYFSCVI